jgi:hypothetical protein
MNIEKSFDIVSVDACTLNGHEFIRERQIMLPQTEIPRRLIPDIVIENVLASVARGDTLMIACERAGISRSSMYKWMSEDATLAEKYALSVSAGVRACFLQRHAAAIDCTKE